MLFRSLYPGKTQILHADLLHLKILIELERLDLRETKVTDPGIAELQEALTNWKIDHQLACSITTINWNEILNPEALLHHPLSRRHAKGR